MFISRKTTALEKLLYKTLSEDICQDFKSGSLLDVGCGNGNLLFYIQQLAPEAFFTGIDFSAKCIKQANKFLHNKELEKVKDKIKFMQGDILDLPIQDNVFDRVISTCAVHHFPDTAGSFAEIYRVLKPGGQALIYDFRKEAPYKEIYQTMKEWSANSISIFSPWVTKKWAQEYWDKYVPRDQVINAVQSTNFTSYQLGTFHLKQRPIFFKLLLIK
ncbi:MAG: class I SAM-dependent methyltransferase [Clostridiales bacterium]|nr:class I SAM-dependent methyltransferase [Clostridiales bacterium]MCF8022306.1 class I SAM-dependent methyltransferase [Clostridiales bacterium]